VDPTAYLGAVLPGIESRPVARHYSDIHPLCTESKLNGAWQRDKRNAKYVEGGERSLVHNSVTRTDRKRWREMILRKIEQDRKTIRDKYREMGSA
jgi:hypothetical protein